MFQTEAERSVLKYILGRLVLPEKSWLLYECEKSLDYYMNANVDYQRRRSSVPYLLNRSCHMAFWFSAFYPVSQDGAWVKVSENPCQILGFGDLWGSGDWAKGRRCWKSASEAVVWEAAAGKAGEVYNISREMSTSFRVPLSASGQLGSTVFPVFPNPTKR